MSEVGSQGQSNSPIIAEVPSASPTPPIAATQLTSRNSSPDPKHSPSPSDLNPTHAPRYGTVIPNRIFVGGIAFNTTEIELKRFFANYGNVKEAKIIADRAGVSKGYGFITFETPEEAARIQQENGDNLIFKDKKLNIGPAVRKQPTYAKTSDPAISSPNGMIVHHPGYSYTYQNGMAYFHSDNQMTSHIPHPAQPPAPSSVYPYTVPVMLPPPPPSPQYIPTTNQAPQYTAYQQPAPQNTPPWSPPTGQWRWMAPPQSPTLPNASMVPVYASCNEMIYPANPYQAEMAAEIPIPMVEPGQAENAAVPGMDQQAAMNRAYIADVTYQEQGHAPNMIPRVNTVKFNGPRKPFPSRGMRRSQGRGGKAVNAAGLTVLANTARMIDDGKGDTANMVAATGAITSPVPEK
ncbi:protein boule-like isoform X3 [Ptychodera flava]|uniref:protein boule-like isoform X3 n=1 Tax=Ptychodera flava TaxID=63121 RepID=UPI00396A042A